MHNHNKPPCTSEKIGANKSQTDEFEEAVLLTEYVIKMSLNHLSTLDSLSIITLKSVPECKNDIYNLLQGMETAVKLLGQSLDVTRQVINKNAVVMK